MEANLAWLEDPTVFRVNRLDAHSDHISYASAQEMTQERTSLRQSLDGTWRFRWSKAPHRRPADFWKEDASLEDFTTIQVPGHMEIQGYDRLQYINKLYPWDGHADLRPPHIGWDYDPVGSYVREFDLAPGLIGKRICISFQGVEQAMYLWLNGHFIGYAEDTFTPSDFDLTPYIRERGNRLCVEVYKHSSAAWLEDQDFFRFSGIFRTVYLYAKTETYVDDLWLKANLADDLTTGTLQLRMKVSGDPDFRIRCTITHRKDGLLYEGSPELHCEDGTYVSPLLCFPGIRLWNHDDPQLYRVELVVLNAEGDEICFIPYDIGFRRVEIVNKIILLNGKRLMLNGVNRHEWNPASGRCIRRQDMLNAMATFKRNNINAVRTSHYPNRSEWYFLCDKEGIYIMDETNMETHGSWQKDMVDDPEWNIPASRPEWKDCVVDRAVSMFQRDKNHPSILFWSCGNESYAGEDILAMADYFRAQDPGRIVHYEGVFHCRAFDQISDVETRMYATPKEIREYLENDPQKPYMSCEYMHNMGNSMGGLESYIRLGEEFPMYQGGFLWDFMDQALWHRNAQGEIVLGYGGDFGERQCDYAFSANGIVTADGHEKPAMEEVRFWYSSPAQRAAHIAANTKARLEAELPEPDPNKAAPLRIVHGDGALGVHGHKFDILFSHSSGGPVSLVTGKKEWIWRAPRPAFWRAPTENDFGCGFPQRSAVWSAVDAYLSCTGMMILEESTEKVSIQYFFSANVMPDLQTSVIYTVYSNGTMDVKARYIGAHGRPQLPLFGLRFSTTHPVEETTWLGLSGETYPDRFKGATFGLHTEVPHIPEYLVPQECGNHMNTQYASFTMGGSRLTISRLNTPFAFSAIPYTPAQLEQAAHRDELPVPCRTVITLCGAMRGVGGIDTWMTDVEPAYHVSAEKDLTLSFRVIL